jgi:hypothetical protein
MQTEKFERIAMFQWRLSLVLLSMSSLNVKLLEFLGKKTVRKPVGSEWRIHSNLQSRGEFRKNG